MIVDVGAQVKIKFWKGLIDVGTWCRIITVDTIHNEYH